MLTAALARRPSGSSSWSPSARPALADAGRADGRDLPAVSGGRLLLNVVIGGDDAEQRRYGDFLDNDERYAQAGEFLTVLRGAWEGEPSTSPASTAASRARASPDPLPRRRSTSAASSPAADRGRRRATSTSTSPGASRPRRSPSRSTACARPRPAQGRSCASACGSTSSPGTPPTRRGRRPTGCSPAWTRRRSPRPRSGSPPSSRRASAGWPRCTAGGRDRAWRSHPNVWAGVGLVRGGAGTALVGSHDEVADRIEEYHDARHRPLHPLGPAAPGGGVLVRRGRDAGAARARAARGGRPAALDLVAWPR